MVLVGEYKLEGGSNVRASVISLDSMGLHMYIEIAYSNYL
jgi:hypothetical protein